MGRIKTAQIKRVTNELMELHADEFKDNFEENKLLLADFAKIECKRIRNIIAGYVTRLVRAKKAS